MASNMIPTSVDCIILGTGLTNAIVAAACSRIGKSVLHVDRNNYYGDEWASFTFQQLLDWIKVNYPNNESLNSIPEELINKSRMFCIDLCPRLLYSNGNMVELLVKSNVSRYHEFKNNIRILSMIDDDIHVMPCRRSDVFTSPLLSDLIDKRRLMKFIEMCIKFDQDSGDTQSEIDLNATKPISEFLQEKGLKHTIKEYIINSIAMVKPTDPTREACEKIKNFMISTERFGRSPFIFPLYGCGEFPQSFCRLSAVFGGVYCLNTQINDVKINQTTTSRTTSDSLPATDSSSSPPKSTCERFSVRFSGNSNDEHEVKSDTLVMDYNSAVGLNLTSVPDIQCKLSRAILITTKSLTPNEENLLSFLRIPPSNKNNNLVYLLEFNSSVMVCPSNINIVYLWTKSSSTGAEQDLSGVVERIFGNDMSPIIWKFYYHQLTGSETGSINTNEVEGLHIMSPPCNDIDYSHSIEEAEQVFHSICPDQEFLPRAPDPDEIIT